MQPGHRWELQMESIPYTAAGVTHHPLLWSCRRLGGLQALLLSYAHSPFKKKKKIYLCFYCISFTDMLIYFTLVFKRNLN